MGENIIVPIDFTVESLFTVKKFLQQNSEAEVNLLLVHGYRMPLSITELLFFSKTAQLSKLAGKEFNEGLTILRNKYTPQRVTINVDLFLGYNQAAFQNFIGGYHIAKAAVPKSYRLKSAGDNGFDVMKFIRKSDVRVIEYDWVMGKGLPEKNHVSELLFDL